MRTTYILIMLALALIAGPVLAQDNAFPVGLVEGQILGTYAAQAAAGNQSAAYAFNGLAIEINARLSTSLNASEFAKYRIAPIMIPASPAPVKTPTLEDNPLTGHYTAADGGYGPEIERNVAEEDQSRKVLNDFMNS